MNVYIQDKDYLKNLTLLYVEDDESTREAFSVFLNHCSGVLIKASNGAEGLQAFLLNKPDIIVTDIRMPVMDGLAMACKIRELDMSVPIIVLTAFDQSADLMKSINLGIDRYVTKPVDSKKFKEALLACAYRVFTTQ
jgi:DNA-binding response OmpR family regulator